MMTSLELAERAKLVTRVEQLLGLIEDMTLAHPCASRQAPFEQPSFTFRYGFVSAPIPRVLCEFEDGAIMRAVEVNLARDFVDALLPA